MALSTSGMAVRMACMMRGLLRSEDGRNRETILARSRASSSCRAPRKAAQIVSGMRSVGDWSSDGNKR